LNCELTIDINPKERKPKNNKALQSNEEFWEHVSRILPEGTDPSYHETFRSAIHCVKDVDKDFQEIDVMHKEKNESEYKIS
jgi:cation transport regulator ChaB